jgi:hypothetical protein
MPGFGLANRTASSVLAHGPVQYTPAVRDYLYKNRRFARCNKWHPLTPVVFLDPADLAPIAAVRAEVN